LLFCIARRFLTSPRASFSFTIFNPMEQKLLNL
jgi:hypothetical protein